MMKRQHPGDSTPLVSLVGRYKTPPYGYHKPNYAAPNRPREVARRARQIAAGKLQVSA